jgi:entericidin B
MALVLTYLSTLTLSACNTVEGVGKDVEAAGDAIKDTARDAKD